MQKQRLKSIEKQRQDGPQSVKIRQVALIITAQNYDNFPDLVTPINDGKVIGDLLERAFGFEVSYLVDPNRSDITKSLNRLASELSPNDNLLVYYAGHGTEIQGDGYWIPKNGEQGDNTYWVSNDFITKALKNSKANNILVISDSCYSGTLSRGIILKDDKEQSKSPKTPFEVFKAPDLEWSSPQATLSLSLMEAEETIPYLRVA